MGDENSEFPGFQKHDYDRDYALPLARIASFSDSGDESDSGQLSRQGSEKISSGRSSPLLAKPSMKKLQEVVDRKSKEEEAKPSMKKLQKVVDRKSKEEEELELMKEKYSKLLLGEDMSGGGKGVCTAVAISNAITNLYATVFGACHKLEPLPPEKRAMWNREMDCLLSLCEYIVDFLPSTQVLSNGATQDVMAAKPRSDILMNLPALEKLETMLLGILDSFQTTEFWYLDKKDSFDSSKSFYHTENKWWVPTPCIGESGLCNRAHRELQHKRDQASQIHKAAMEINSGILSEMEIPASYRYMATNEQFSPENVLNLLALSSEHEALEIADHVEAAMLIWRRKASMSIAIPSWDVVTEHTSDGDKNLILACRARSLLLCLKQRYPGLAQTTLDTSKIQYNKDVGQAILESYSRVLESFAYNIVSWIDDVLLADENAKKGLDIRI